METVTDILADVWWGLAAIFVGLALLALHTPEEAPVAEEPRLATVGCPKCGLSIQVEVLGDAPDNGLAQARAESEFRQRHAFSRCGRPERGAGRLH